MHAEYWEVSIAERGLAGADLKKHTVKRGQKASLPALDGLVCLAGLTLVHTEGPSNLAC